MRLGRPSAAVAHDWMSPSIFVLTSWFGAIEEGARRSDVRLSMNSRDAISEMKWAPPFLTHVSVSCRKVSVTSAASEKRMPHIESSQLHIRVLVADATLERAHSLLGRN